MNLSIRQIHWLLLATLLIASSNFFLWATYNAQISAAVLKQIENRYGRAARARVDIWQNLIKQSQQLESLEKVKLVNDFFNHLTFKSDQQQWDKQDYWATPIEFLSSGSGDCEDFTIAKYFTLIALGIDDSQLRINYVKALELNQAHMVLTYYSNRQQPPWVLDNINPQLLRANERSDLKPIYSFNSATLWKAKERERGERLDTQKKLPHWAELNQRMRNELQGIN